MKILPLIFETFVGILVLVSTAIIVVTAYLFLNPSALK